MRHEATAQIVGNVCGEPESRTTKSGKPFVTFSVAVNESYFDRGSGSWATRPASFFRVKAFDRLAQSIERSLRKGEPVMVRGRLEDNQFVTREGETRRTVEIRADYIGHDLSFGVSKFTKDRFEARADYAGPLVPSDGHDPSRVDRSVEHGQAAPWTVPFQGHDATSPGLEDEVEEAEPPFAEVVNG